MIITCLSGAWYLGFFAVVIPKFPSRPAARELNGRGIFSVAYGQLWADLIEISLKYPEALK